MRLHAGLPKMCWKDSVTTITYLINRGPFVPLGFQIPEEEWQEKEVSLTHLRVFGCDSYVKVKDVTRDKLDAKSVKCTLIGYGSKEMRYRFWESKGHKVVRSRDVTFNEDSLYGAKAATDSSEGSENSKSFEDNGRSDEEDSEDKASSEVGGSKTPHMRRSTRESRALVSPSANYLLLTKNGEPESYSESLSSKEFVQWKKAINEEMVSLEKNQTWSLVRLPVGKKELQSKWVFRVKEEQDGRKRYKARLVVKGFQQKWWVDYNKIFSPVVKMTIIRLVLSIVAAKDLHLEQLDVKTSFLHGDLDEDIYMTQEEGFQSAGKEENLIGQGTRDIKKFKRQLSQEFEMKDLGPAKRILGMSIIIDRTKGTLRLSQEKYTCKVLEKFNIKDAEARCQPLGGHFELSKKQAPKTEASRRRMAKVPYASAVGSVIYAMVYTWPNIAHAVGVVSRFIKEGVLEGFSDSNYGGCLDLGKSTTGYVFTVGGTIVSWMSRIQKCVAISTTEAEYIGIAEAGKELICLNNFFEELDRAQTECVLFCDNQSAIHLAKNLVFHGRTKHIKIRYHYIQELVSEGMLSLKKILGAKNPADMLTKVVMREKLKLCAASTGLRDN
ncbi:putative RNA-directed DNA polymerase [Tanacetum coccineum]